MADWYAHIDDDRRSFIERQHIFFVATAPSDPRGTVNLSPKGRTLVKVLGPNLIGWLDYPGSGNETKKHTDDNGRITVMFCSFEKATGITRLYGHGRAVDLDAPELRAHRSAFMDDAHPYVRQAFFVDVEKVQTSCGYAVPLMDFVADRETLDKYCERKLEPLEMEEGFPRAGEIRPKGAAPAYG
ncbi:MAG: pyridoxamine 5'-phosphate oxidase family protein [Chloroflexi bacterium]|nr:pyridoxamine 5'-phosphate oxidase family protein [Chloroflexota bacterium]